MTVATKEVESMPKGMREAIVDQLRACQTPEEIINFENFASVKTLMNFCQFPCICDKQIGQSIFRKNEGR